MFSADVEFSTTVRNLVSVCMSQGLCFMYTHPDRTCLLIAYVQGYWNSWLSQSSAALESQKLVRRVMVTHRRGAWEGFRRVRRTEVLRSYPITLGGVNWLLAGRGACTHAVCVLAVWRVVVDRPLEGVTVPRESEGARATGRGSWDGAPKGALLQGAAGWKSFLAKRRRKSRWKRRIQWWDGSWPWLPKC